MRRVSFTIHCKRKVKKNPTNLSKYQKSGSKWKESEQNKFEILSPHNPLLPNGLPCCEPVCSKKSDFPGIGNWNMPTPWSFVGVWVGGPPEGWRRKMGRVVSQSRVNIGPNKLGGGKSMDLDRKLVQVQLGEMA